MNKHKLISFATKEENKLRREKEFLSLTPSERVERFIQMIQESALMFGDKRPPKDSFQIYKKNDPRFRSEH